MHGIWKIGPRILLRTQGMLVLDAFRDYLTLDVRPAIHPKNTDLIMARGMTS
jgi:hypothetical protein